MKVLLLGDFSGYHASVARGLRRRGHQVTVVSDGTGYMDTERDITLRRRPGVAGALRYLYDVFSVAATLRGYDVVQLVNAHFLNLRPGKISYFLRQLKRDNGLMSLSHCSTDHFYAKAMLEGRLLDYSEYNVEGRSTELNLHRAKYVEGWLSPVCRDLARSVYETVDGAVTALYEYHKVYEPFFQGRIHYAGIGVDTDALAFRPLEPKKKINVFVGIKPETARSKGIYTLLEAVGELERRHPDRIAVTQACRLPLSEYLERLAGSDVVVDQLYSYTPATNALQAMAMGKVVISGGEEAYYDFIGEPELRPVINADPRSPSLADALEPALLDTDALCRRSRQGRLLVERHNTIDIVAGRFEHHWQTLLDGRK